MKRPKDIKWIISLLGSMTVLVGIMTDFTFRDLAFQLHDTYFVFGSFYFIVYGTAIIYTIRNLFLLIDLLAERYKVIALLISIINPLVALFLLIVLYLGVHSVAELRSNYPGISLWSRLVPVVFLVAFLIGQVIVEVRMLRKLREVIV